MSAGFSLGMDSLDGAAGGPQTNVSPGVAYLPVPVGSGDVVHSRMRVASKNVKPVLIGLSNRSSAPRRHQQLLL